MRGAEEQVGAVSFLRAACRSEPSMLARREPSCRAKMDTATESEHIEKLEKEAESLKIRLEDERQKLNDVTRKNEKKFNSSCWFIYLFL